MDSPCENAAEALQRRQGLARALEHDPYSIDLRLRRSETYECLGYPDLAVMDTYKALLLVDEVVDETAEYHDDALESLRNHLQQGSSSSPNFDYGLCLRSVEQSRLSLLVHMARCLQLIGCLRPAYDYAQQAIRVDSSNAEAHAIIKDILRSAPPNPCTSATEIRSSDLPESGSVRREVYPWNEHEARRTSRDALESLNRAMQQVAPKLEVRATALPVLHSDSAATSQASDAETNIQLGVFATTDVGPGDEILRETSLLTGNSRLHEPMCDACSALLPALSDPSATLVPCSDCDDIVFCSQACHDLAQAQYHAAICGMDVDTIAKDLPPNKAADGLYTLLLFRALAMAATQKVHPLDLFEVKYIWGDFAPSPFANLHGSALLGKELFLTCPRTLPFDFSDNVLNPLHLLEMMEINIFTVDNDLSEAWVWNTLYAKFRGTASARISPRDGRPEVAAVHPLWCLANHSCDPNVSWEWAGEVKFHVRETKTAWCKVKEDGSRELIKAATKGGIHKGDQILNHYVDIDLPVSQRREWAVGALGGICMCQRCVCESSQI